MEGARSCAGTVMIHDDVIKWKHFPRYWPFVRGIHRSPGNSHHKGPVTRSFDVFFDLRLNKRLSKHTCGWWFETPSRSLRRHCDAVSVITSHVYVRGGPNLKVWELSYDWTSIVLRSIHFWLCTGTGKWLRIEKDKLSPTSPRIRTWASQAPTYPQTGGPLMMTSSNGNIFRVTGHLCGEFTGPRWIPRTKASDAELWCFLWSVPEKTVE